MRAHLDTGSDRLALSMVMVLASVLVVLAVRDSPQMSHVDELAHFDYLVKASKGTLVRRGDRVGEVAMREEACRGIDVGPRTYEVLFWQPKDLPDCSEDRLDPERFPEHGYNTAYIHPPTYYAVTGLLARGLRAVTPVQSLLTAGRLVGVAWLWLTLALLWWLFSIFSMPLALKTTLSLLFVSAPVVIQTLSAVNPDAVAPAMGSAVLLAAIYWEKGTARAWVPMAAAALSIAVKSTNVIGVGLAMIYLLYRLWGAKRSDSVDPKSNSPIGVFALLVGVIASGALWLVVSGHIAKAPTEAIPQHQRFHVDRLTAVDVLNQGGSGLTVLQGDRPPPFHTSRAMRYSKGILNWTLVAATIAAVVLSGAGSRARGLSIAVLVALVASGPIFALANFLLTSTLVSIPPRYAVSAVPALFVAGGSIAKKGLLLAGLLAVCSFQVAVVLWGLVGG